MYTLGGGMGRDRALGSIRQTFNAAAELKAYKAKPDWFGLGDRDLTNPPDPHPDAGGAPLSAVTAALCARWQPGVGCCRPAMNGWRPMLSSRMVSATGGLNALPGVVGAPPRLAARRAVRLHRRRRMKPARCWKRSRRRMSWCCHRPTRWCRSARSPRSRAFLPPSPRRRRQSSVSPGSSWGHAVRGWPISAWEPSASRRPHPRWRCTTAPDRRGCSTGGWWTPRTPTRWTPSIPPRASGVGQCQP